MTIMRRPFFSLNLPRARLAAAGLVLFAMLAACNRQPALPTVEHVYLGLLRLHEARLVNVDIPREGDPKFVFSCDCVRQLDDGMAPSSLRQLVFQPERMGRLEVDMQVESKLGRAARRVQFVGWVTAPRLAGLIAAESVGRTKDSLLLDVRNDFRKGQVRVSKAVSMPLRAVRHRLDWKDRNLFLLGDGLDQSDLLREADALRTAGFVSVQVVDGGAPAWLKAGGTVEGTPAAVRELTTVQLGEVMASIARGDEWIVLVPPDLEEQAWPLGLPVVRAVPGGGTIENVLATAAQSTKTTPKLLVADPAFSTETLSGLGVFRFAQSPSALRSLTPSSSASAMTISSDARNRSGSLRASNSGCGGCPGK
jgi:rhodanese-related sulfurtransferase